MVPRSSLEEKVSLVEQSLRQYALQNSDGPIGEVQVLDIFRRPFSNTVILSVDFASGTRRLVMKSVVHHHANAAITEIENQAVVEFEILRKIFPYFVDVEECGTPKPLFVLPEIETYVMEFVEGELLMDKLRAANYFASRQHFTELQQYFYQSGKWLKHFQESTGIRKAGPEILDEVIERCDQQFDLIEKGDGGSLPSGLRHDVIQSLKEQQDHIAHNEVLVCGRHGDFGSWNIIAGAGKITVIDYLGYKEAPLAVDLLKMLSNFNNDKKSLLASPFRMEKLKDAFLNGYGQLPELTRPQMIICEALHRTMALEVVLNSTMLRFYHAIEKRRQLKDNLNWLMFDRGTKSCLLN